MTYALKREERKDALVIPIYLRRMYALKKMSIAKLQILPNLNTPLLSEKFSSIPDEGFSVIAEGVVQAIKASWEHLEKVQQLEIDWECISYTMIKNEEPVKKSKEPFTVDTLNELMELKLDTLDFYQAKYYAEK